MSVSDVRKIADLEKECIDLVNRVIRFCKVPLPNVSCIKDIDSNLIISLFEIITQENIPDLLHSEDSIADAHNVQAVIDTLSLDLLGISLSHITGENIVAGDAVAIYNLLEIFEGILLISSDKPEETEAHPDYKDKRKRKRSEISSEKESKLSNFEFLKAEKHAKKGDQSSSSYVEYATSLSKKYQEPKPRFLRAKEFHLKNDKDSNIPSTLDSDVITYTTSPKIIRKTRRKSHTQKASDKSSQVVKKKVTTDVSTQVENIEAKVKHSLEKNSSNNALKHATTDEENINLLKQPIKKRLPKLISVKVKKSKPEEIEDFYELNYETKVKALLVENDPKHKAFNMKKKQLQNLKKPIHRPEYPSCNKSFLLPHYLRRTSISGSSLKRGFSRKRQPSAGTHKKNGRLVQKHRTSSHTSPKRTYPNVIRSPAASVKKKGTVLKEPEVAIIKELMEEFPGLQLPSHVLTNMTKKYERHLMTLHKLLKDSVLTKSKSQVQAEAAVKRQSVLSNMLKKEVNQRQVLKELNEQKASENKIKYHLRDARLEYAKMKQYCDEFQNEMRKKMQKRNFSEELIAENTFKEVLKLQKEQVQILCDKAKESGEHDAKQHLQYLEALENLYQNHFSMLAESLAAEKKDVQQILNAQKQITSKIRREFQENLELEVRDMQKNIVDIVHDTHFRELDSEQYKQKIKKMF